MNQPTPDADRLPPHSHQAEAAVLASVIFAATPEESTALMDLASERKVTTDWFYDVRHRLLWTHLADMHAHRRPIIALSLVERFTVAGLIADAGGLEYVLSLERNASPPSEFDYWIKLLREWFQLRRIVAAATKLAGDAMACDGTQDGVVEKILAAAEEEIAKLSETATESSEKSAKQIMQEVIADIDANHYTRGKAQLRGLPLGEVGSYIDKVVLGIRENHYAVVAARPGDGKTSWALNILEYLAHDYVWHEPTGEVTPEGAPVTVERKGIPIAVFSIEMDQQSLGYRLLFARAGVSAQDFNTGYVTKAQLEKIGPAATKLSTGNWWVDASPAQTIGQIAAKARRMARQYGIKLFVLDYLQLVETEDGNGYDRVRELTKISRKIMALKKQLNVPWLVLAQMNRNIEQSEAKRVPVLSDLKDCGAIEQDADVVMFLYKPSRDQLDRKEKEQDDRSDNELLEEVFEGVRHEQRPRRVNIFVAKNRFGPTGNAKMLFQNNLCRFEDWHLWKLRHNLEARKKGERPGLEEERGSEDML